MTVRALFLLLFILLLPIPQAFAVEEGFKAYDRKDCEFTATLPVPPYKERRCPEEDAKSPQCYDIVNYTKVYELKTTVSVRLTCNPADGNMYERYNTAVMKATLEGMVSRNRDVKDYRISLREQGGAKVANLVGSGEMGLTPTLYVAQIWIGRESVFTVEAQLIGEELPVADAAFRDILTSIHPADAPVQKKEDAALPADKEKTPYAKGKTNQ